MSKIQRLQNKIICGDCLEKLKYIPDESVDLIYLDLPFFSNRNYEIVWGNKAEMKAYGDRWKGGINVYIDWIEERVREMYRVLKPTGSIYLHCDKHANHHLRLMLDRIFGEKNFRNEIIWAYRTGGASKKHFSRKHDNIYFYTKSNKWTFNLIKEKIYYDKPFFSGDYKTDEDGRIYTYVHPRDIWEIKAVLNVSKERIGYPTQKPEALLEKIILASSNEGDIVLDPFVGGGTTCVVANLLGRKYIGIDVSHKACAVTYKRLRGIKVSFDDVDSIIYDTDILQGVIDFPASEKALSDMSGLEYQDWCCLRLGAMPNPKKTGDKGIDGFFRNRIPVEIKQGAMSRPHIQKLHSVIVTEKKDKGVIVGKSIPRTVWEIISELKNEHDITIIPIVMEELITGEFEKILKKHKILYGRTQKKIEKYFKEDDKK